MRTIFKKVAMLNGIALFAFMLLAPSNSIGQTLENDNQRTSVYLHPTSLIASFVGLVSEDVHVKLCLNLTGEFPLSERYAFIANPHMIFMSGSSASGELAKEEYHLVGSGIGIRRFVNGNADGFYLQLMPNITYGEGSGFGEDGEGSYSAINVDILGYIGYSIKYSKISLFFDAGIGYGISHYLSLSNEWLMEDFRAYGVGWKNGLSVDINIGVGIPFL
jgi:hypothetical protein